jgi:hypothetical protein
MELIACGGGGMGSCKSSEEEAELSSNISLTRMAGGNSGGGKTAEAGRETATGLEGGKMP